MLVYLVRNKIDGKLYVGQTTLSMSARWRVHLKEAKRGMDTYLYRAIRKYGAEAFSIEEICHCANLADLSRMGIFHIARLQTYPPSLSIGYNMTTGGEGFHGKHTKPSANKGLKMSEETRRRMSLSRMGNKYRLGTRHSDEDRAKISAGGKGRKMPAGFGDKVRKRNLERPSGPRLGMKTPEVTRLKQVEARRKAWAARSPEERAHVSRGARRPKTEEHRKKLSEATTAYWAAKRAAASS